MDDLRSCYSCYMRFPGVGLVRVRWYFTEKDYLPLPHVFGSNNWIRDSPADRDYDDGAIGEVWTSPQPWANGQAPDFLSCSETFGSAAAWRGEEGSPVVLTCGFDAFPFGGQEQGGAGLWPPLGIGGQEQGGAGEWGWSGQGGQQQGGSGTFESGYRPPEAIGVLRLISGDFLKIDRSGTVELECTVSYLSRTASAFDPGQTTLTRTTAAGQTTIMTAGLYTTNDEVDWISVHNKGGSSEEVSALFTHITDDYLLVKATIPPDATLEWTADSGWVLVIDGVAQEGGGGGGGSASPLTTKGDLWGFSTLDARVPVGSNGQAVVADSTAALGVAYDWQRLIQRGYDEYTTHTALSATIPNDDTIPQDTEGTEILSVTITPKRADSIIRLCFQGQAGGNTPNNMICALFQSGVADALAARLVTNNNNLFMEQLDCVVELSSGSTSARSYSVRAGPSSGNMYLNGDSGSRYFGGVSRATLTVDEFSP